MNEVVTRWLAPDLQLVPALPEPDYEEPAMLEPV
ncbi:flagellar assembly protein FliH, partial [Xanthomonas perforans]|nr:flagellar assembly protein FliH [Xanthomonas perforans]